MKCNICGSEAKEAKDKHGCSRIYKCEVGHHFGNSQGLFVDLSDHPQVTADQTGFGLTRQRAVITVRMEVNMDMMPGWGHQIDDWVVLAEQGNLMRQTHYNPVCTVLESKVVLLPTVILEEQE